MTDEKLPGRFQWPRALTRNLINGIRGAFFLRLQIRESDSGWTQLVLLVIAHLGVQLAWDFYDIGWNGEFTTFGLPGALFELPILLFAAWMLARLGRQPEKTLTLTVVFCAIGIPFDVLTPMLQWLPARLDKLLMMRWGYGDCPPAILWYALSCGITAGRLLAILKLRGRVFVLLLMAIVIAWPLTRTYRDRSIWIAHYDRNKANEEMNELHALDREDVFYLQPKLLQQELDAVAPQRHDGINLFFVGVAGYSEQDVFMKEIKYVDKLFKERFDTEGHSILLINNPNSVKQLPIASATSLGLALKKVGDTMDKDEDILFLYLTSHGSQDHVFSLNFGSMQFDDLNPQRLRKLLDDSGIKHRVVVVGACYSGGFVDALKSDDTLVMTSAASDRTSFGCSDDEDFTYFGRAYFTDALSKTDSFIDAFTVAKPIITTREKQDDFIPSNPQISIGDAIKSHLDAFGRQQLASRVTRNAMHYKLRPVATTASTDAAVSVKRNAERASSDGKQNTADDKHLEAAQEFIATTAYEGIFQDAVEQCKESISKKDGPEKIFEKNQHAFHGLTPQSPHWPEVVKAYRQYREQICNAIKGENTMNILTHSYAATMTTQELGDATKFMSTPLGHAFVMSSWVASRALNKENAHNMEVTYAKADEEYNKTLAELVATDKKNSHIDSPKNRSWWRFW